MNGFTMMALSLILVNHKNWMRPQQDELLSAQPSGNSGGSPDLSHAIEASNQVYSKRYNEPLEVRVNSQKEIDTFVNDEHKAIVSELLNIMGNGDNPRVKLGSIVSISTSMRGITGFEVQDFGKFLVTAVYHQLDGVGHYQNTFEGVSADSEKLSVKQAQKPSPDMQLANVIDNEDPQKQGRVKVQFKWQCTSNDVTEWLRVVTPDAGSSDKVNKNRGFVFIPEVGDQVLVAFEEGNVARPIVIGSMFSGKSGTGGGSSNNVKALTTRSGNTIILNDNDGSVNVKDPSGNVITLHGNGQVTLTAPNSFTINTKDFIVNASNSVAINAQPGEQGGGEGTINISAKKTIAATADTEGITIDATTMGVAITGKTDVSVASTSAAAILAGTTETHINGADVKMDGTATIRINSNDTDIT
jgi:type VI secretion system secreted protein VgrG